jgi:hypothetical protein
MKTLAKQGVTEWSERVDLASWTRARPSNSARSLDIAGSHALSDEVCTCFSHSFKPSANSLNNSIVKRRRVYPSTSLQKSSLSQS